MELAALTLPHPLPIAGAARLAGTEACEAALLAAGRLDGRSRKQMSRPARLATLALQAVLADASWTDRRDGIGLFLGVGGSGADLGELTALIAGSADGGHFSLQRFGERGLGAANPLLAFQLMNNFTLCHGAIACGVGGPNGAYFSRGGGTVSALRQAAWSILDGECERAVAGGADSALHPVTLAELGRAGALAAGLCADEGAALLALGPGRSTGAWLLACGVVPGPGELVATVAVEQLRPLLRQLLAGPLAVGIDQVVTTAAVAAGRELLSTAADQLPGAASLALDGGEALAATPALSWCRALDLIEQRARRVLVLSLGLDGELGVVLLGRQP